MNRFIREGSLLKKCDLVHSTISELDANLLPYSHAAVLVMILRLRQICAHPYLILVSGCYLRGMTPRLNYPSQTSDESSGDATAIAGVGEANEVRRAIAAKGYDWVNMVR